MKTLKILILACMLAMPLALPGAGETCLYSFELDGRGFGNIITNDILFAHTFHRQGTFQAGVNSFSVEGGKGNVAHNGLLTFDTGAWTKGQGWTSGSLTLNFGNDKTGQPMYFLADHLKITYELDIDHHRVFRIFMTDYSRAFFSAALAKYLGIPEKNWKGSFELVFYFDGRFKSFRLVGEHDGSGAAVPIPPTALLFGAGLVGIGLVRNRFR